MPDTTPEELREHATLGVIEREVLHAAADTIERLAKHVERLCHDMMVASEFRQVLEARIAELEAENTRLKAEANEPNFDVDSVVKWMREEPRRAPELAFTSGDERACATLIDHQSKADNSAILNRVSELEQQVAELRAANTDPS